MSGSIYMAAIGALASEKRLQVLSNNLANVNTVGFKQDKGHFKVFDQNAMTNSNTLPLRLAQTQAPSYWMQFSSYPEFSSGELKKTGNLFDLALIGKGFFCVRTPQGIQYTRKGDFTISSEELLVTQEGWPVLGESGEIPVKIKSPSGDIREFTVSEDGNVTVDGAQVDRLRIVDFPLPGSLEKVGNTLFRPTNPNQNGQVIEDIEISQGFLELSNVNVIKMMTEMIEVLRGYESYQKMIRAIDDMNAKVISDVGRSA